ncbi:cell division protein FtsQ/DivIB [Hippea sp. KM1]|uniref:cell division protein FtsQ/DivIB n=1 Tax=Hippea sp. KM1 TaxID=944481 RepID=UPI00046CE1E5|nr:FtsQ-type POTRA domain-containing protein [Hippea sp. KM1]
MLDYKDLKNETTKQKRGIDIKFLINIAKLTVSLVALGGFFVLLAYGYNQYSSRFAKLRYIVIEGNSVLPKKLISSLTTKGKSLKLKEYREDLIYLNLISNPWIKEAHLAKIFPDTMYIKIKEKEPKGMLIFNKTTYIIDENGSVIDTYKPYLRLPSLKKITIDKKSFLNNKTLLRSVMNIYEKLDKVEKINYIEIVSNSYQLVHFKGGLNVAVNSFDCPEKAIVRLKEKWSYLYSLKDRLDSVSICFDNKFVLRWKKGVKR